MRDTEGERHKGRKKEAIRKLLPSLRSPLSPQHTPLRGRSCSWHEERSWEELTAAELLCCCCEVQRAAQLLWPLQSPPDRRAGWVWVVLAAERQRLAPKPKGSTCACWSWLRSLSRDRTANIQRFHPRCLHLGALKPSTTCPQGQQLCFSAVAPSFPPCSHSPCKQGTAHQSPEQKLEVWGCERGTQGTETKGPCCAGCSAPKFGHRTWADLMAKLVMPIPGTPGMWEERCCMGSLEGAPTGCSSSRIITSY